MTEKQINFLAGPSTLAQLKFLRGRFGGQASALRIAIDRMYREETQMDRVQQVNWINELASNIADNLGEGSAEELVEYALSDEGREAWGITIPEWFDAHDRNLLVEQVRANLS